MGKLKKKKIIRTASLIDMLRQTNLGGTINECSLSIKKGRGHIEVVDVTNSIIVISNKNIASRDISCDLGFGNLPLLISFLNTIDDDKISIKYKDGDDYFMLKRKDGRRRLNYLLTQVDLIATNLSLEEDDDKNPYESMKELMEYSVELTPTLIKDFLKYIGILGNKETTIYFNGEDNITFRLGSADDHQFELSLSEEVEGDEGDEIELIINGEHLAKVFNVIEYSDDDPPILSFAKDKPVMIEVEGVSWSLNPLTDFEEGE